MKSLPRLSSLVAAPRLAELLRGRLSWRQMLRTAPSFATCKSLGREVLIGFVPHADYPAEILLTFAPMGGSMVPVAGLGYAGDQWSASPMMVKMNWLLEREAVAVEPADWLMTLGGLAQELRARTDWQTLDMTPWEIAASWPHWESAGLSWQRRAKDLADRLGINPLSTNTLMVKCRRLGLVRR